MKNGKLNNTYKFCNLFDKCKYSNRTRAIKITPWDNPCLVGVLTLLAGIWTIYRKPCSKISIKQNYFLSTFIYLSK